MFLNSRILELLTKFSDHRERTIPARAVARIGWRPCRHGLTFLELIVAISIMVMIMGSLGAMATAVNQGASYGESYGTATQHARVALDRIATSVREATSSDSFPGAIVLEETVDGWTFPDTLVVWYPGESEEPEYPGESEESEGIPCVELRVYCPDPANPSDLVEMTFPDAADDKIPCTYDESAWLTKIAALKASPSADKAVLTSLLHAPSVDGTDAMRRGAVRFNARYRPETVSAAAKDWPLGMQFDTVGLRQTWIRTELQLLPTSTSTESQADESMAIPFLGSASLFYMVHP